MLGQPRRRPAFVNRRRAGDVIAVRDETGWTLSTTHAAATLMSLLRAVPARASTDEVMAWLKQVLAEPRKLPLFAFSALLLACNWLVYVWAVSRGRVVEASLGYFITPLLNVVLGVVVLRELPALVLRLRLSSSRWSGACYRRRPSGIALFCFVQTFSFFIELL